MTGHRLDRVEVEHTHADTVRYVAVCGCGWQSDPKFLSANARRLLFVHVTEAEA